MERIILDKDFNEIKSIINVNEKLCVETNPCQHEILFELKIKIKYIH